ncbi:MAG: MFS transporter [Phycisphaerae bacterium]|nr:MFS transporter [Phycisphaerae bacterium]MDZ4781344.1 MFS transporter [Planctomycetia bacterium]
MTRLLFVVFLPFAVSYFLSFLFRSVNAVIASELSLVAGLSAGALGMLTAAFFLGFAVMQLPMGLLLDRYGARRVQGVLLIVGAAGSALFAVAQSEFAFIVARALIGAGMAGGLMAGLKALVTWFPQERIPLINGMLLAAGGLGAIASTWPVIYVLEISTWRVIFWALAAAAMGAAVLILTVVPEKPKVETAAGWRPYIEGLSMVLRDRTFWRVAPISITGMGASLAIQTLWAGPWLSQVNGLDRREVTLRLFALTAGMTAGFLLTGVVAQALLRRGISLLTTMIAGSLIFIAVQGLILLEVDAGGILLWIVFGLIANVTALVYPLLAAHFSADYVGRAGSANTFIVFLGTFVIQYLMGLIIEAFDANGQGARPALGYKWSFGAVLLLQALAVGALLAPHGRRSLKTE